MKAGLFLACLLGTALVGAVHLPAPAPQLKVNGKPRPTVCVGQAGSRVCTAVLPRRAAS